MTRKAVPYSTRSWMAVNEALQCNECKAYFARPKNRQSDLPVCRKCKEQYDMPTMIKGKDDSGTGGGGAWAQLPIGIYPATLKGFTVGISAFEPDKERYEFQFELEDETGDDGSPIVMRYWANAVLSPRSTLASIVEAMGHEWSIGEGFDLDELVGGKCRLMTGRKTPQGKTEEIAFVQSVVALDKPKAAAKKAAGPAAATADEGIGACVSCGEPGEKYTGKGKPICEECAG